MTGFCNKKRFERNKKRISGQTYFNILETMTTIIAIFGHLFLNFIFGFLLLSFHQGVRNWGEVIVTSLFLGFYIETMLVASFLFLQIPLYPSVFLYLISILILAGSAWKKGLITFPPFKRIKVKWFEWILLVFITEKIVFGGWQIAQIPLFFADSFVHWAGRGKAIFYGVNWSFDVHSPVFLGILGGKNYPLGTPIWKAITAMINNEWNDIIARADGIVFFILIIVTIWLCVYRFSENRFWAAGAAFIFVSLPFNMLHAIAGYNDIAVAAFVTIALATLLRKEWVLSGIFIAGAVWMKNDALFFFVPSFFVAVWIIQLSWDDIRDHRLFSKTIIVNMGSFIAGFATLFPWIIFKQLFVPGFGPSNNNTVSFGWHSETPVLLMDKVLLGPTHGIFWVVVLLMLLIIAVPLLKDQIGRSLFFLFLGIQLSLFFVFGMTRAFDFLQNEMTINRSMLQTYSIVILMIAYGVSLSKRSTKK